MSYCINSNCLYRENGSHLKTCASCGTSLLIRGRYFLTKPIRNLERSKYFEVFEAEDILLEGQCKILKVLKVNHEGLIHLFRKEAQVLSWLEHPGIPAVDADGYFAFPSEAQPDLHCLVMEKVEGQDLGRWIQNYPLTSPQIALKWLKELVQILDQIHKNNLFHGDIKPSNIIRKPNGQIVLIDFGAVKQTIRMFYEQKEQIILTPGYAPPEQLNKEAVLQSDFYALGRTFVHLLTGKHPIDLTGQEGQLVWRQYLPPKFPILLADFIDKLMAPKISDRPSNTDEALEHIDQIFHTLLASPTPESSELFILAEAKPNPTANKLKPLWKNHIVLFFIVAVPSTILWAILASKPHFKTSATLPILYSVTNLLPKEVALQNKKEMRTIEKGKIVATASFYPQTSTFIVDDTAKDSRRAYVEYRIPSTGNRGVCEDADGANSPIQSCHLNLGEHLNIYWRVCVRDADGPKPTICTGIRKDQN